MLIKPDKNLLRKKRHLRVRNRIAGTPSRPRLNVFRSLNHIYAQLIDDLNGITLASANSLSKDFQGSGGNIPAAKAVGLAIAKNALSKGIHEVVFDRAGYIFHGRIAALVKKKSPYGLIFLSNSVFDK